MKGKRPVQLLEAKTKVKKTRFDEESWEGVDRGLFDKLRYLRREIAEERGVPAYLVFGDATLRDMARVRPSSARALLQLRGIGERKLSDLGERFLTLITEYCRENGLPVNVNTGPTRSRKDRDRSSAAKPSETKQKAFAMFARGASVDDVATATERAPSTVWAYLVEFVQSRPTHPIDAWVSLETVQAVAGVVMDLGSANYMKPIFDRLEGKVPYEHIRLSVARLETIRH